MAYSFACSVVADMKTNDVSPPQAPPPLTKLYLISSNDKFGFVDANGKLQVDLPEDVYTVFPFSDGLAVVARRVPNTNGRWGFIDDTGTVVIEPKFNVARPFSEGLAAVITELGLGYIDKTGRIVIPPQFGTAGGPFTSAFSEGLAAVPLRDKNKWGYIDKSGRFAIAPTFSYASPFSEGRAWAAVPKNEWSIESKVGMLDKEGHWIVEPRFDSAGKFSEGLASVRLDKKTGYINRQGQIVINFQFDAFGGCPDSADKLDSTRFSEGLAAVQENWKWGFIDRTGKFAIKPSFDCAEQFSEGLAVIGVRDENEGRWRYGYIDKTGAIVIEPRFGLAHAFSGGLALVGVGMTEEAAALKAMDSGKTDAEIEKEIKQNKMKHGYIDKTGKFIWQPTN
jgi:hypothetical protein